ncbi:replication protein A 32 kDa subunit A-like [Pistacia vera]|uniref:replication protein A 32 kDa subunit A-like n=1 Tax=Pistacia vera TaxID=55513 RepID=UPI001263738F|nr:replication protein A 32 kDa subunit A-like [Pistacia vera]
MNSLYSRIETAKVLLISGEPIFDIVAAILLFFYLLNYSSLMCKMPVTSFDEVTFHFIDCIYFQSQKSKSQQQGLSINQPQVVDSSLHTPVRTGTKGYQTAPSNNLSSQFGIDGLKDCDQMILDYLQQPSSSERERGVHITELSQHLKIPEKKIMDSIVSLENEGLIYSTIDEFHYKFARG